MVPKIWSGTDPRSTTIRAPQSYGPKSIGLSLVPAYDFLDSFRPAFALSPCPVLFTTFTSLNPSVAELHAC